MSEDWYWDCPKCGSKNTTCDDVYTEVDEDGNITKQAEALKCFDCGHTWVGD